MTPIEDYIPAAITRRRWLQGLLLGLWLGWLIGWWRIGLWVADGVFATILQGLS